MALAGVLVGELVGLIRSRQTAWMISGRFPHKSRKSGFLLVFVMPEEEPGWRGHGGTQRCEKNWESSRGVCTIYTDTEGINGGRDEVLRKGDEGGSEGIE
jgi:hypothetical protein